MSPRVSEALEDVSAAIDRLATVAEAEGEREVDVASCALTAIIVAVRQDRAREGDLVRIVTSAASW